ncbi:Ig-like domain repeat protein [Paenibacillus sp. TRM 82003]|nr:Ig-like domain repeat protein [Paenibacillus sp. TRM 82003]
MGKKHLKKFSLGLVAAAVALGTFSGTALGASTRFALVTDVTGTVKVTKAGGTKEIRAFNGMGLNEGDKVKVEKGSSLELKIADRNDEVTLGENWNGVLSKLKDNEAGGKDTALKTWSGSMYSSVQKLTGSSDTYKVETPTAVMGVRGTHLTLVIDPITGLPMLFVNAGRVAFTPNGAESGASNQEEVLTLPSMMATAITGGSSSTPTIIVSGIDPLDYLKSVSPQVIGAVLTNKESIDRENEETVGNDSTLPEFVEGSILDLTQNEALANYRENVDNLLFNLLNQGVAINALNEETVQQIIDTANRAITEADREYDLNRPVPKIDPNAGIDPELQALIDAQREQALRKQNEALKQRSERQQQYVKTNADTLADIVEKQKAIAENNAEKQKQKAQEASQQYQNAMTEAQRQQYKQRQQKIEEQANAQEERRTSTPTPIQLPTPTPAPTTSTDSDSGSGSGSGSTKTATTTTLTPSPTSAKVGDTVTFTADVRTAAGAAVPTGSVVFTVNGTAHSPVPLDSAGKASLPLASLPEGTTKVTAAYSGTASYEVSSSVSVSVPVRGEPKMTAAVVNTPAGFDVELRLDNFLGADAVYGAEIHLVHETSIDVIPAVGYGYYDPSKYPEAAKVGDSARTFEGFIDGKPMEETVYGLLMVASAGGEPVEFDENDRFATIQFAKNTSVNASTAGGEIKISYILFLRKDGTEIIKLSDPNVPAEFTLQYN